MYAFIHIKFLTIQKIVFICNQFRLSHTTQQQKAQDSQSSPDWVVSHDSTTCQLLLDLNLNAPQASQIQ